MPNETLPHYIGIRGCGGTCGACSGLGEEPQGVGNIGYVMLAATGGLLLGMLAMYVWHASK